MSQSPDFNKLNRPEDATKGRDAAFDAFKEANATVLEYRNAYEAMARRNPAALTGLPHPDGAKMFDHGEALARLRKLSAGMVADPAIDLKT